MYFDNLTITALVIFVFEFGLVLRFCVFGLCGGPLRVLTGKQTRPMVAQRARCAAR